MGSSVLSSSVSDLPPAGGSRRLLLAVAAAGVVGLLGWAAVYAREKQVEAHSLSEELAARIRSERAAGAVTRAVPAVDLSGKVADLEKQVQELEQARTKAADAAVEREKALSDIITFLRQENTAAQETIKRLSTPPPEPEPPVSPVKPPRAGTRRTGSP